MKRSRRPSERILKDPVIEARFNRFPTFFREPSGRGEPRGKLRGGLGGAHGAPFFFIVKYVLLNI